MKDRIYTAPILGGVSPLPPMGSIVFFLGLGYCPLTNSPTLHCTDLRGRRAEAVSMRRL